MAVKIILTLHDDIDKRIAELALPMYGDMVGIAKAEILEEQHYGKCAAENSGAAPDTATNTVEGVQKQSGEAPVQQAKGVICPQCHRQQDRVELNGFCQCQVCGKTW